MGYMPKKGTITRTLHLPPPMYINQPNPLVEFCTDSPIPYPIHLQLKHQSRTLNPHIQGKVQIIEFDALGRCQPSKQALRNRVQVCSKRAHVNEALAEGVGRGVSVARNEVVFDDERLAGPKVACIVEGYGL
jgi:hypothetical protein